MNCRTVALAAALALGLVSAVSAEAAQVVTPAAASYQAAPQQSQGRVVNAWGHTFILPN